MTPTRLLILFLLSTVAFTAYVYEVGIRDHPEWWVALIYWWVLSWVPSLLLVIIIDTTVETTTLREFIISVVAGTVIGVVVTVSASDTR